MSIYLVFGLNLQSYVNKKDVEVTRCDVQYFDPKGRLSSPLEKGFRILSRNVFPDFDSESFPELPGYYNLEFRQKPAFGGKSTSRLVSVELQKSVSITSTFPGSYVVLGVNKIDFLPSDADQKTGKRIRGVAVYYTDPFALDSDVRGLSVLRSFSSQINYEQFQFVPGCYEFGFDEYQGKYGADSRLVFSRYLGVPSMGNVEEVRAS